jgi:hypothetical protein
VDLQPKGCHRHAQALKAPISAALHGSAVTDQSTDLTTDEIETVTASYYDTIDRWFPIISRKRLVARITRFEPKTDASVALLLLCMKLVTQILPSDENPRTGLYWICRQLLMQVEGAPLLSLTLLQATALMAVYEVGHGIYPAGMMTVGNAVRLGRIMGLHDRDNAQQLFRANSTLTGREEERRAWWGVVVLDRYAHRTFENAQVHSRLSQNRHHGHF